jgi:hypothetical protein
MLPPRSRNSDPIATKHPLLHEEVLANGLLLRCREAGNRYFGDYHRVVVAVEILLPLDHPALSRLETELLARARARFGTTLITHKSLERMGVATAAVADVQKELLASFLKQAHTYLARPDLPVRLLLAELERQRTGVPRPPRQ